MSRKSETWNAYESKLAGPLPSLSTSVTVESTAGLDDPAYLVIDPDKPTLREWIRVGTISPGLFENIARNQEGSVGNIDHDTGAIVRAVFTKQLQDDIFEDIEDIEGAITGHVNVGQQPDPHIQYLKEADAEATYVPLAGTQAQLPMTGALVLYGPPTADLVAATKLYVDDLVAAVPPQTFLHADLTDIGASDHHVRYANSEAVAAMGGIGNTNPLNHSRYTNAEAVAAVGPHFSGAHGDLSGVGVSDHHVRYSDAEATAAVGTPWTAYLPLTGGTLTGDLVLPAGTNVNTSLRFVGMGANDGLYGTASEMSIGFGGFRHLTVFEHASPPAQSSHVEIRGDGAVPLAIIRGDANPGTGAIVMRIKVDGQPDLALTYADFAAIT